MKFFLIIFIFIPLTEMVLLFEVADRIGGLTTLGLVVLTAVIGLAILKQQGLLGLAIQPAIRGKLSERHLRYVWIIIYGFTPITE